MNSGAHDKRNIVLTGFMGTGKSTVGKLLAEMLGFDFIDTDVEIESRHGLIKTIFAERGEAAFRAIERDIASELAERTGLVIATGGRMMLDPVNVASLSRNGRVFCLVATPEEILDRVTADSARVERPLLTVADPHQRIVELLAERKPEYGRFAQLTTDARTPETVAGDIATLARSDPRRFAIDTPTGDYEFAVGAAVLPFVRQLAAIDGPLVIVTSEEASAAYLASCSPADLVITLPSGPERHKDLASVQRVYDQLLEANIDRSATIMSLGDSIVGDIAAFTAATYLRGLDLVHCPTDLIAMIDTSVGGKVGLDVEHGRNLIGLYKQPKAVVADVATLQTLAPRVFAAGMAEVLKHALIAGSDLLDRLESSDWRSGDTRALPGALGDLQSLVAQAVQVKIAIVQEDPFETDRRQVLNLGHTFAHALEQIETEQLIHGEAVGIGLIAAARLSEMIGVCDIGLGARIEGLVAHLGLPTRLPRPLDMAAVVEAMKRDKKRRHGRQRFVLLRGVGDPVVTDQVSESALAQVLNALQPLL